jgi:hypothetical protein
MMSMLLLYNFVSNIVTKGARYTEDIFSSFIHYVSGLTSDWYFLDDGPVPVVHAPVYKKSDTSHISWVYNSSYNVLAAPHSNERSIRLPFLSACIVSNNAIYPIDDFLEEFHVIHSDSGRFLTPREIVLCWEIYNRTWLQDAVLKVIDRDGEEHTVDGFGDGGDAWYELLYEDDDEEDTEEEEEEGEDEATEEGEGDEEGEEETEEETEEGDEETAEETAEETGVRTESVEQVESLQEPPLITSITLVEPETHELVANA